MCCPHIPAMQLPVSLMCGWVLFWTVLALTFGMNAGKRRRQLKPRPWQRANHWAAMATRMMEIGTRTHDKIDGWEQALELHQDSEHHALWRLNMAEARMVPAVPMVWRDAGAESYLTQISSIPLISRL